LFRLFSRVQKYTHTHTHMYTHIHTYIPSRNPTCAVPVEDAGRVGLSRARERAFLFLSSIASRAYESPITRPTMLRAIRVLACRSRLTSRRSRRMTVAGQNPSFLPCLEKGAWNQIHLRRKNDSFRITKYTPGQNKRIIFFFTFSLKFFVKS